MRLVIAIVQSADSGRLTDALVAGGLRTTRIPTVGGFLHEPNVTMLVVTEDEQVERVLSIIRQNCQTRRRYINAAPMVAETAGMPIAAAAPLEVIVGGATVFVLPVRHFVRLGSSDNVMPSGLAGQQGVLILSVVQAEDAGGVTTSLTSAGYRLTRMNSVGGFLKKGNATLLIGVQAHQVDHVLGLIHAACRQRPAPQPARAGIPMYGATVFVLDVGRVEHA